MKNRNLTNFLGKIYSIGGDLIVSSAVGFSKGYAFGSGEGPNLALQISHYSLPFVNGYLREFYKLNKNSKNLVSKKNEIHDATDLYFLPVQFLGEMFESWDRSSKAFNYGLKYGGLSALFGWASFGIGVAWGKS